MKPSEFKNLIKAIKKSESKRAILIQSSPGVGKTQLCGQVAAELGIGFKAIHAPLLQPEDYGMPVVHGAKKDQLKFIVSSEKFPLENSDCEDSGIFLIDELPQADQSAQKILANLVQEREIHGHKLKPNWLIVATGNRQSDRAGANRILGHLGNRVTRLDLETSLDDWTQWALSNGVQTELVAFLRFRPELLTNYDAKNEINATPRAWVEGVGARLGVIDKDMEFSVFAGDVGEGPASEFLAFLKIFRNLPNPDAILLNPNKVEVPGDPATLYALCGALVNRVNATNFGAAMTYAERMPPEFTVLFLKDSSTRCPDVLATKEAIQWLSGAGAGILT